MSDADRPSSGSGPEIPVAPPTALPQRSEDLADLLAEVERQNEEASLVFDGLPPATLGWRPDEGRWSIAGHLDHLAIVNGTYMDDIEEVVARARDAGRTGAGPFRHPWVTTWFARSQEPPPKRRMKTFRSMVPDPAADPVQALPRFLEQQRRLSAEIAASGGLDLGRVRFGSPFLPVLRFSLGTGFAMLLAHNRRHVWLAREVMASDGFPGSRRRPAG